MTAFGQTSGKSDTIDALCAYSTIAQRWLSAEPALRDWLFANLDRPATFDLRLSAKTAPQVAHRDLRQIRNRIVPHTMARDVAGLADFREVVSTISRFAAHCIVSVTDFHAARLHAAHGVPCDASGAPQSLITVGMGKLGGEELNVSSDIDIMHLFPAHGETNAKRPSQRLDNSVFFTKLAQQLGDTLSTIEPEGFVFRVDTRLRPFGDEGSLAISIESLETYLIEYGRFWERLAWLRSASITGDKTARTQLGAAIRPFVYRRYLDYDAYDGLRDLHEKIRAEGFKNGGETNIKLGRGGIRELEFFVQVQQLVRGGRDPSLQQRSTLAAIDALENAGVFSAPHAHDLRNAYPFLRRVEHFLQYQNDAQTQTLPTSPAAQISLALAMGFTSLDAFQSQLAYVRGFVAAQFDNLAQSTDATPRRSATSREADIFSTWQDAATRAEAQRYFAALNQSQRFVALPPQSRARLVVLLPKIVSTCGAISHGESALSALKRWGDLIEALAGRSAYLALLAERAPLLGSVTKVLAASAWAAQFLRDHPILLDELLDRRSRDIAPNKAQWATALAQRLAQAPDTESKLDALRRFQQTELFRILLNDLDGALRIETLSDQLSDLADVVVEATVNAAWSEIAPQVSGSVRNFAIIAYGRWGGKDLGYGSDLDLVFLVADDVPLEKLAKLAQRTQSWLTTLTSAGRLYEIDTALRPDGASGMLLSTISAFATYQKTKAWRWEHQALSRARFAVGDAELGAAFERVRRAVLATP